MRRSQRGLSLLEMILAFFILAVVSGFLFVTYTRMFAFSRKGESELIVATHLEAVGQVFRQRAKKAWPDSVTTSNQPIEEYFYSVEDLGLVENPVDSDNPINLKKILVSIDYKVKHDNGATEDKTMTSVLLVGR